MYTVYTRGGGGTPYVFHMHMCRQNALFFMIFLSRPPKNGHLLSICPTNSQSQASQIIIDQ